MTKNKLWLTSLMVVMGIGCLSMAACEDNETSGNSVSGNANQVVLADFEEWAPDFQLLRLREDFGAIEVNKDADFVKSGEQSAKLYVMGSETRKNDPYFFIQTQSDLFGYDYSDFGNVESVSAWMYNPSAEETELSVGLITEIEDIDMASLSKPYSVTLKQGWNKIVYEPDMNYVISSVGVDNYEGIKGLYFMFDKSGATTKAEAPQYYIDDVTIQYGERREFVPVRAGTYYAAGSVVGGKDGLFLENPIDMDKLIDKALHFEFKFDTDEGSFGFAFCASNWPNVTGTLVVTKKDGEVTANFGKILALEDGWYAWEHNASYFAGDGLSRATDVGLIYYAGQIVEGNVEINWLTLSIVEPPVYTREELAAKYETGDKISSNNGYYLRDAIPMTDLSGKAIHFEFKFDTDEGSFGFVVCASNNWANVTGTVKITKSGNSVTSTKGRIVELDDGWYAWEQNASTFAGDGLSKAIDVGMVYHGNQTVTGTLKINWTSFSAVDAYALSREEAAFKYTEGEKISSNNGYQLGSYAIPMTELNGKAIHFEFKFDTDEGSFGFVLCASDNWANVTGTVTITKSGNSVTSKNEKGRIVELGDGWYAWEQNASDFTGDGLSRAADVGMVYHGNQTVTGTVKIDWTSFSAVDKYKTGTKYTDGEKISSNDGYLLGSYAIPMTDLSGKAIHFEFKFETDGEFSFVFCDSDNWANVTGTVTITKSGNSVTSTKGRIVELGDGWYAWEQNASDFAGDGLSRAADVSMVYHGNKTVTGTVKIDWTSLSVVDAY